MKISEYKDTNELLKRLNACKYSIEKPTKRQMTYNAAINDACRIIDALPVADVTAVRHGKWIDVEGYEGILYRCSICEDKRHRHTTIKYNYCPDCGAKMDLEGDVE